MTDPDAEVIIKEYITACYGTTEYPEDMTGILLSVTDGEKTEKIEYEYKCREAFVDGAKEAKAVVNAIDTEVTLTTDVKDAKGFIREGYAFSPMFTLGFEKKISDKEVYSTWLNLAKAN